MSDYVRIKEACLQRNILWEDREFPATQSSVFYHQTPPFLFEWKRPRDIFENPTFILEDADVFDVVPGRLGDKWLLSCLGILFLCRGLFERVVLPDQDMDIYAGIFRFRIWWCGKWEEVIVDDLLPTVNGNLAFLQTANSEQIWPALLEKAYAKLHGSYEALKYGSVADCLADLTGGIIETRCITEMGINVFRALLDESSVVTARFLPQASGDKYRLLQAHMNYVICELKEVETTDGVIHLVRLNRPNDYETDVIVHVLDTEKWESIPENERESLTDPSRGFWATFEDFVQVFSKLEIIQVDIESTADENALERYGKWHKNIYQTAWKRGLTAGGCKNHPGFFHLNPQVQVTIENDTEIIVSLNQHSVVEPKVIGFSVLQLPAPLSEPLPHELFRNISSFTSPYNNSRVNTRRLAVRASAYLIMPTTYEPRQEGNFTLRIFSKTPVRMDILDDRPQMTKNAIYKLRSGTEPLVFAIYEAIFLQLADENKTINLFDLQDLLDACLPNDYIKSCVSIDTCRQIVLTFDMTGSGRISLNEFKNLVFSLRQWQVIFKRYAIEKMGVIRAERLKEALRDVGFVVPQKVMAQLIIRFMRKDGMLRFGDYVSAVLHLQRAFVKFYIKGGGDGSAHIEMSLSEWLYSALN